MDINVSFRYKRLYFCVWYWISKPKFLTKEERAKLAIQRRAEEIQLEKEKAEKLKAQKEALDRSRGDPEAYRSQNRARGRDMREYDDRDSRCRLHLIFGLPVHICPR